VNPLLWLGAGGLAAYLLLRHKDAAAATLAPPSPQPGTPPAQAAPQAPTPGKLAPVAVGAQAPKPLAPQVPPSTKPPQITIPAPPFAGELAAPSQPIVLTGRW